MAKNINVILSLQDRFTGKLNKANLETLKFKRNLAVMQYGSEKAASVMKSMERFAIGATATAATAGGAFAKASLDTYKSVNEVFNDVAGIKNLKATDKEMQDLIKHTKEYAKEVKGITYEQAGEMLKYMTLAGWDSEQSKQAMPAFLKALRIDNGANDTQTVADALTDSMTAVGLKSHQADEYIDLTAAVQSAANTNILQLQEALIKSGAGMTTLYGRYKDIYGEDKGRIQATKDTMALVGALSSAGIKAKESGTVVNSLFTRFVKDSAEAQKGLEAIGMSMYDNNGNLKITTEIFTELAKKAKDLNEQERNSAFAKIGGRFRSQLEVLINAFNELGEDGQTAIEKINKAMENSKGYAQAYVDTLNSGYSGKVAELSASWFNFKDEAGEILAPYVIEGMDYVINKLPMIEQWMRNKLPSYLENAKGMLLEIKDILSWIWEHKEGVAVGAGAAYAGLGTLRIGTTGLEAYDIYKRLKKGRAAEKGAEALMGLGSADNVVDVLDGYVNFGKSPISYTMPVEIGTSLVPVGSATVGALGSFGSGTATAATTAGTATAATTAGTAAAGAAAGIGVGGAIGIGAGVVAGIVTLGIVLKGAYDNSELLQESLGEFKNCLNINIDGYVDGWKKLFEMFKPYREETEKLSNNTLGLFGDILGCVTGEVKDLCTAIGLLSDTQDSYSSVIDSNKSRIESFVSTATAGIEKVNNLITKIRNSIKMASEYSSNWRSKFSGNSYATKYSTKYNISRYGEQNDDTDEDTGRTEAEGGTNTNALGTNWWKGGKTSVNERGGEIMDLPQGTRIYPADKSQEMMNRMAQGNGITVIVNVENFYGDDERYIDRVGNKVGSKLASLM